MASLKVIRKKYQDADAYQSVVSYIVNPEKTRGFVGGVGVNPDTAVMEMEVINDTSRIPDSNRLRHTVLSFEPADQVTPEKAFKVARDVADYYGWEYQIIFGVHLNTKNTHIHFAMNVTSYRTGKRYHGEKWDFYDFKDHVNTVLRRHNLKPFVRQVKDEKCMP